jgi:plastocyanin
LVLLGLAAAGGFALLPGAAAGATVTDVTIANFRFSPNPVTISVGDTLQWTNQDGTTHTVTSDDGQSFDSGPRQPGATFTHTFDQARTFAYHCNIHPSMRATVKVVGDGTTTTVAPPTTTTSGPATTTTRPPTTTTTGRVTTTTATTPPGSTPTGATPSEPAPPTSRNPTPPTTTGRAPIATTAPAHVTATEPSTSLPRERPSTPVTPATTAAPAPITTPPSAAVALGVARGQGGHGSGRTGFVAAGVGLALGSAGWWVRVRRRRSSPRPRA